jgi:CHAT domain-containing protein/tetratricopeptide (TPR) repeat protein
VIVRRFRAILLQSLCLALNLVWLADCFGQAYPIPNPTEGKSYHPPFWMWQNDSPDSSAAKITKWRKEVDEANELWLKQDTDKGIPKFENLLLHTEWVFGKDSPEVGVVLCPIGLLYCGRGDFERGLPYLERSLKILSPLPDNAQNLGLNADLYCRLANSYGALLQPDADNPTLVALLIEIGSLHSLQGRPLDAIPLLERALAISEKKFGRESTEAATALASLGNARAQAGQFEPALASLKRSLQIREEILSPTNPDLGMATFNLGFVYAQAGNYGLAMPLLERSKALFEKSYIPRDGVTAGPFALALNNLGSAQLNIGEYDKGISTLQRGLAVNELAFGNASINLVDPLNSLAEAYSTRGDFDRAQPLLERALRLLEGAPSFLNGVRVSALNSLAWMLLNIGDDDAASKLFSQAKDLGEKQLDSTAIPVASSLDGLALINERRGNIAGALALSERSLRIREKKLGPSDLSVAVGLHNASELVERSGDPDRARSMLQKALAIEQKTLPSNHPNIGKTLDRLATLAFRRGNFSEAQDLWRESIAIADSAAPDSPDTCQRLGGLGSAEIFNGDVPKGVAEFVEAWKRLRRCIAGQTVFQKGSSAASLQKQEQFGRDWFNSLCELAPLTTAQPAAAQSGAEQLAFGKALLEEIETIRTKLTAEGRTQVQALREQADSARMRLMAISTPEGSWMVRQTTDWQNSQRDKVEAELKGIEEKLASASGLVSQIISESKLSLTEIARHLPPNAALVDFVQYRRYDAQWTGQGYAAHEQRYAAYLTFPLVGDSANVVVERVDLGEAAPIDEAVGTIAKRFAAGQYRAKDLPPAFQRLSDLVYAPLAKHLSNASHLIICPDGQLNRIPFEMLPVGNKFLVEEKTISYVTSGREVVRLAGSKSNIQSSKSLVMGDPDFDFDLKSFPEKRVTRVPNSNEEARGESGTSVAHSSENGLAVTRSLSRDYRGLKFKPLPGAEAEARSVAKLLGGDAVLRLGPEAREAELKSVRSPRVLDLATHGFFLSDQEFSHTNSGNADLMTGLGARQGVPTTKTDWENPLARCGIALAGANRASQIPNAVAEDGLLTGLEASLLNLQGTELVILSACDSGSGEVKIGEGVMSLGLAFRIAGAETVLASHWNVNDKATSLLMTEFMRRWRAGESRANAWREAQLTLLRSKDFSNPFFWAAFTLTGEWR